MLPGKVAPLLELGELPLVLRQVHAARGGELEVPLSGLLRESPPDPVRLHHDGQLVAVAPLLAHPAPVAARLLARDPPLLDQRDLRAVPREEPGGRGADDAGADHRDVDGVGQRIGEWAIGVDSEIIGIGCFPPGSGSTRLRREGSQNSGRLR